MVSALPLDRSTPLYQSIHLSQPVFDGSPTQSGVAEAIFSIQFRPIKDFKKARV